MHLVWDVPLGPLQPPYTYTPLASHYRELQVGYHLHRINKLIRIAMDKLNQFVLANTIIIIEICGRITMLVYYIVDLAYQLHASAMLCTVLCKLVVLVQS